MTPPPTVPPDSTIRETSGLAIASLVLGIIGFGLPVLASIPAVITGHLAIGRIRRSGGSLGGEGMATTGLVLGYISSVLGTLLVVLATVGFVGAKTAVARAKEVKTRRICMTMDQAVLAFHDEYGQLPGTSAAKADVSVTTNSTKGARLVGILLGMEPDSGRRENIKQIRFFEAPEAKGTRDGVHYSADGKSVEALYDPWGGPYRVLIDGDYDDQLPDPSGSGKVERRVLTYSFGKNGRDEGGRGDDVGTGPG